VAAAYARCPGIRQIRAAGLLYRFGNRRHAAGSAAIASGTVRTSARCADHFLIRRKAAGCLLGEGKAAIDGNLENPAAGLTQGDVGGWMGLQDQVPRCQGARLVASHAAEFNFDLHLFGHPSVGGSACSLAATVKMGKKDAIFGCKE
jgi:hypothetical protein